MSSNPKRKRDDELNYPDDILEELPPLDHDETKPENAGELAELIIDFDERELPEAPDTTDSRKEEILDYLEGELLSDFEENGNEDLSTKNDLNVFSIDIDEPEESWTADDASQSPILGEDWLVDDLSDIPSEDDDGAEGPIEDSNFIDFEEPASDDTDRGSKEDESETALRAMARLGIDWPGIFDKGERSEPARALETLYLGPSKGAVKAVAFVEGAPVAVGNDFFVLGADGMLHPGLHTEYASDLQATSVCVSDEYIFVGTMAGGAIRIERGLDRWMPVNSWVTHGFTPGGVPTLEQVSTSFELTGQRRQNGSFRLFGRTLEGQLFMSEDAGETWTGSLTEGRCMAVAPMMTQDDFVVLTTYGHHGLRLLCYTGLKTRYELTVPPPIVEASSRWRIMVVADANTIVLGALLSPLPAFYSSDGGQTWRPTGPLTRLTALALDNEDPSWMIASTLGSKERGAQVWLSEDGAKSWCAAMPTGDRDDDRTGQGAGREAIKTISRLVVEPGISKKILCLADSGVYLMTLRRPGLSH